MQALGLFPLMVATVQVARALADQRLTDAVLEQGIDRALALLASTPRD